MDFKEVVFARHSVREISPDSVPEETLRQMVELAGQTPSWENSQPWKVYIATGETLKHIGNEWSRRTQAKAKGAPDMPTQHRTDYSEQAQANMRAFNAELIELTGDPGLEAFSRAQGELFHATAVAYLTLPKNASQWSVLDLGAFEQTLMLAAKDLGVDSIPAYAYAMYPDVVRRFLPISDDEMIAIGVGLGYPTSNALNSFRTKRLPIDDYLVIQK